MDQTLSGKIAVVTGGSRGIGQAVVVRMAAAGASVVIAGLSDTSETCSRVLQAIGSDERIVSIKTDVNSLSDIDNLFKATFDKFDRVDILVNNAGINRDKLLLRMSVEDWEAVINTNLRGTFLCTQAVLSKMIRNRYGRIINISSVVGIGGNPGQGNYAASKAGIIGLTKTTAREVALRGVTVNAVAPGFIDTDMTRNLSDQVKDSLLSKIPIGRFGTPEDVAFVVEFLASVHAEYITGQVINIDGGMFMT